MTHDDAIRGAQIAAAEMQEVLARVRKVLGNLEGKPALMRRSRLTASGDINRAIETLRAAGAPAATLRYLDGWNASRLVSLAQTVQSQSDAAALFAGIAPSTLARKGIV